MLQDWIWLTTKGRRWDPGACSGCWSTSARRSGPFTPNRSSTIRSRSCRRGSGRPSGRKGMDEADRILGSATGWDCG